MHSSENENKCVILVLTRIVNSCSNLNNHHTRTLQFRTIGKSMSTKHVTYTANKYLGQASRVNSQWEIIILFTCICPRQLRIHVCICLMGLKVYAPMIPTALTNPWLVLDLKRKE